MAQEPSLFSNILKNLETVIHGKRQILRKLLIAYFAGGHILLEDIPGVGKTTLAKALAISLNATFNRVQFTPDLMPADITGSMIYNPKTGEFCFRAGPVFADILLADEINRASPRTQSALLEAMNEWQVSVEGKAVKLQKLFTVVATQNPVSFHGTYPLPEAQLDRFLMKLTLGYPENDDELAMLNRQQYAHPIETLASVADASQIIQAREEVKRVNMGERVTAYLLQIIQQTREDVRLKIGVSPRGSLALYRTAQSNAWAEGRDYAIPDDVKTMAVSVLSHRLVLETKVRYSGTSKEEIIQEILESLPVPVA